MNTENKTNNQDFKKFFSSDNLLKIVIALSILILSFSIFYRFVFYEKNRKKALEKCLLDAEVVYSKCWEEYCEEKKKRCANFPYLYEDCPTVLKTGNCKFLPIAWAEVCEKQEEENKNECFKKFK
jgi:hypothetical protein